MSYAPRILIVTNRVPFPLHDGGALAMHAMISGYQQAGWEVFLLSMNTARHYVPAAELSSLYQNLQGFEAVDVDNRIRPLSVARNLLFSHEPEHAERFYHSGFEQRLGQLLRSYRPDVVQFESVYLATYLPVVRRHSAARAVLRLHNIEYQIWQRLASESQQWYKRQYLRHLAERIRHFEQRVWPGFDLLLPITHTDARALEGFSGKAGVVVAPFGIDTARLPATSALPVWEGYHIGAMDWLPNVEAMDWLRQDIWPLIRQEAPDFCFHFAGRQMPARFMKNLPEGMYCAGEVPSAQAFVGDRHILVVPLRSGGGIRVKILEAMAAGKLVISTDVGMQGIEATPGRHYLAANEAPDFARALRWALDQPGAALNMGRQAALLVQAQYDQHAVMQRVIHALDSRLKLQPATGVLGSMG